MIVEAKIDIMGGHDKKAAICANKVRTVCPINPPSTTVASYHILPNRTSNKNSKRTMPLRRRNKSALRAESQMELDLKKHHTKQIEVSATHRACIVSTYHGNLG